LTVKLLCGTLSILG